MEPGLEPVVVYFKLSLFGLDISITSAVVVIWLACLIIFLFSYLIVKQAKVLPGRAQSVMELIYEFWDSQTKELFGDEANAWLPFVLALFAFVLTLNLLGLVPNMYPITANINVTVTLAILVFLTYHFAGIRRLGIGNYLKSFFPQGMPIFIVPFLMVIELLSQLARPFSLAIRLFANMTAGHLVSFTILSLIFIFKNVWLAGFPLLGRVTVGLFEVFVAFIQAYVFAYLAALYIGLAISEQH